jgi:DNA modification methylase
MTKVTEAKLSEIKPDQANANRHTERGEGMIRQSISKFGFAEAGTLDKDNNIIGGNLRTEASADLGMEDAIIVDVDGTKPVYLRRSDLSLTDPSDTRAKELAYALNRVAQVSIDFNPEQVLADLDSGVNLADLFREDELSEILGELGRNGKIEDVEPQIDKAAELQAKWGTATGQVWELGGHRLAVGDCTDRAVVEAVMRGERADLLLADPPYGKLKVFDSSGAVGNAGSNKAQVKYYGKYEGEGDFDLSLLLESLSGFYKKAIIWGGNYFADILPVVSSWLVWDKRAGKNLFYADCELAWSDLGITAKMFDYTWQGMIREGEHEERQHPTQKPVPLYEWCLSLVINAKIVIDPTLGSGSSLVACQNLGRKARGIEIDSGYAAVAIERFYQATNIDPVLIK